MAVYLNPTNNTKLSFKCRLMEFSSPELNKKELREHKKFVQALLYKDKHSLRTQSKPGHMPHDGFIHPLTLEQVLMTLYKKGNPDGWGIVKLDKAEITPQRSIKPAYKDKGFIKAADEFSSRSGCLMAHVRLAGDHSTINKENTHPFISGKWAFMHNGGFKLKENSLFAEKLDICKNLFDFSTEVDTKQAFGYFIGSLKENGIDHKKDYREQNLSFEKYLALVEKSFAKTIMAIEKDSVPTYAPSGNNNLKIKTSPSLNFVISDGNFSAAYRNGAKLYVGRHSLPGGREEFVVSSEDVSPKKFKGKLIWEELENGEMVIFTKKQDGSVNYVRKPLEMAGKFDLQA